MMGGGRGSSAEGRINDYYYDNDYHNNYDHDDNYDRGNNYDRGKSYHHDNNYDPHYDDYDEDENATVHTSSEQSGRSGKISELDLLMLETKQKLNHYQKPKHQSGNNQLDLLMQETKQKYDKHQQPKQQNDYNNTSRNSIHNENNRIKSRSSSSSQSRGNANTSTSHRANNLNNTSNDYNSYHHRSRSRGNDDELNLSLSSQMSSSNKSISSSSRSGTNKYSSQNRSSSRSKDHSANTSSLREGATNRSINSSNSSRKSPNNNVPKDDKQISPIRGSRDRGRDSIKNISLQGASRNTNSGNNSRVVDRHSNNSSRGAGDKSISSGGSNSSASSSVKNRSTTGNAKEHQSMLRDAEEKYKRQEADLLSKYYNRRLSSDNGSTGRIAAQVQQYRSQGVSSSPTPQFQPIHKNAVGGTTSFVPEDDSCSHDSELSRILKRSRSRSKLFESSNLDKTAASLAASTTSSSTQSNSDVRKKTSAGGSSNYRETASRTNMSTNISSHKTTNMSESVDKMSVQVSLVRLSPIAPNIHKHAISGIATENSSMSSGASSTKNLTTKELAERARQQHKKNTSASNKTNSATSASSSALITKSSLALQAADVGSAAAIIQRSLYSPMVVEKKGVLSTTAGTSKAGLRSNTPLTSSSNSSSKDGARSINRDARKNITKKDHADGKASSSSIDNDYNSLQYSADNHSNSQHQSSRNSSSRNSPNSFNENSKGSSKDSTLAGQNVSVTLSAYKRQSVKNKYRRGSGGEGDSNTLDSRGGEDSSSMGYSRCGETIDNSSLDTGNHAVVYDFDSDTHGSDYRGSSKGRYGRGHGYDTPLDTMHEDEEFHRSGNVGDGYYSQQKEFGLNDGLQAPAALEESSTSSSKAGGGYYRKYNSKKSYYDSNDESTYCDDESMYSHQMNQSNIFANGSFIGGVASSQDSVSFASGSVSFMNYQPNPHSSYMANAAPPVPSPESNYYGNIQTVKFGPSTTHTFIPPSPDMSTQYNHQLPQVQVQHPPPQQPPQPPQQKHPPEEVEENEELPRDRVSEAQVSTDLSNARMHIMNEIRMIQTEILGTGGVDADGKPSKSALVGTMSLADQVFWENQMDSLNQQLTKLRDKHVMSNSARKDMDKIQEIAQEQKRRQFVQQDIAAPEMDEDALEDMELEAQGLMKIQVEAPDDLREGETFWVTDDEGHVVEAIVPAGGVYAGELFVTTVEKPNIVRIRAPDTLTAGSQFTATLDGQMIRVTVPEGGIVKDAIFSLPIVPEEVQDMLHNDTHNNLNDQPQYHRSLSPPPPRRGRPPPQLHSRPGLPPRHPPQPPLSSHHLPHSYPQSLSQTPHSNYGQPPQHQQQQQHPKYPYQQQQQHQDQQQHKHKEEQHPYVQEHEEQFPDPRLQEEQQRQQDQYQYDSYAHESQRPHQLNQYNYERNHGQQLPYEKEEPQQQDQQQQQQEHQQPHHYQQEPNNYQQEPQNYQQEPQTYQQEPHNYQQETQNYQQDKNTPQLHNDCDQYNQEDEGRSKSSRNDGSGYYDAYFVDPPPEVRVKAPRDLPEGYMFNAEMDGEKFTVTVPNGGVKEGKMFDATGVPGAKDEAEIDKHNQSIQLMIEQQQQTRQPGIHISDDRGIVQQHQTSHKPSNDNNVDAATAFSSITGGVGDYENDDCETEEDNEPKYAHVKAPGDLPEGFKFKAQMDGQILLATVPKGGVKKGEFFPVPLSPLLSPLKKNDLIASPGPAVGQSMSKENGKFSQQQQHQPSLPQKQQPSLQPSPSQQHHQQISQSSAPRQQQPIPQKQEPRPEPSASRQQQSAPEPSAFRQQLPAPLSSHEQPLQSKQKQDQPAAPLAHNIQPQHPTTTEVPQKRVSSAKPQPYHQTTRAHQSEQNRQSLPPSRDPRQKINCRGPINSPKNTSAYTGSRTTISASNKKRNNIIIPSIRVNEDLKHLAYRMYSGDAESAKSSVIADDDEFSSATVQLMAPFDMPGGYKFQTEVDGEMVPAQVPPNGVTKGQIFFPLLEEDEDESDDEGDEFGAHKALADDLSSMGSVQQSLAPQDAKSGADWQQNRKEQNNYPSFVPVPYHPQISPKSALRAAQQKEQPIPVEIQNKVAIALAMQRANQQRRQKKKSHL